jgi:hypothetical protein
MSSASTPGFILDLPVLSFHIVAQYTGAVGLTVYLYDFLLTINDEVSTMVLSFLFNSMAKIESRRFGTSGAHLVVTQLVFFP